MSKCTYIGGYWATNIGNAFYDLGILYALRKVVGADLVSFIQDSPSYGALPQTKYLTRVGLGFKQDPIGRRSFDYISSIDSEYVFMSGPLFTKSFNKDLMNDLVALKDKGVKIVFISAGGAKYDEEEVLIVKDSLKRLMPYALISRDEDTYNNYNKCFEHSYNGICFAFFSNDYHVKTPLDIAPYVVLNFDKGKDRNVSAFCEQDDPLSYFMPNKTMPKRMFLSGQSERLCGHKIIRTDHEFHRMATRYVLKKNWIRSDTPDVYLSLYSGAVATYSERVHACVPTLSFGKPATLLTDTPRSKIFDRVGLEDIKTKLVTIDQNMLHDEKMKMIRFLSFILNG